MADKKQQPESDLIPESPPQSPEPESECKDDQDDQDMETERTAMLKFMDEQFNLKMKELCTTSQWSTSATHHCWYLARNI